eukprot:TRINITY_DN76392_c0_g1_i1.p1 TRINITY_DN76392_c0_g1~~TRINITY_DN76392_c0_g1_i1.p1  ORF type:complete len:286 (-),score=6.80 TRINITY_DN76392_c0_g1_i1:55-885(-)
MPDLLHCLPMASIECFTCRTVVEPTSAHEGTVILLHGLDDNGNYWRPFYQQLCASGARISGIRWLALDAPKRKVWGQTMRAWFEYYTERSGQNCEDEINEKQLLEVRSALHVMLQKEADSLKDVGGVSKLLLVGSSQGGSVALDACLTFPGHLPVGGVVVLRGIVLGATLRAMRLNVHYRTPVLAVSGMKDKTFCMPLVKRQLQAIQSRVCLSHKALCGLGHNKNYDARETNLTIAFIVARLELRASPQVRAAQRKCPGGCGLRITWHKTHCCKRC